MLLSYENEAILARQNGADFDYVVPDDTLLIENPGAVTERRRPSGQGVPRLPHQQGGPDATTPQNGFRPLVDGVDVDDVEGANDPTNPFPTPAKLLTIDKDFGGWAEADDEVLRRRRRHGIVTKIQSETGTASECDSAVA